METKEEILKDLEEIARSGTGKVWLENPLNHYKGYKNMSKKELKELRKHIQDHQTKLIMELYNFQY